MQEEKVRKQQFLENSLHERQKSARSRDAVATVTEAIIKRERDKIKRQYERLETVKHKTGAASLPRGRRLSLDSTIGPRSRLFDFEAKAARSRRQMQNADHSSTPSATRQDPADDVKDASQHSHGRRASINDRNFDHNSHRRPSVTADNGARRDSLTSEGKRASSHTEPHTGSQRRGSVTTVNGPRRASVTSDQISRRPSLRPDKKVSQTDHDVTNDVTRRPSDRRSSVAVPSTGGSHVASTDIGDEDAERLRQLYDRAIETVQQADDPLVVEDRPLVNHHRLKMRRHTEPAGGLDVAALNELQSILNDARTYSSRKPSTEDHNRLDVGSNRAQKKRIEHLEMVLRQLNHGQNYAELDPEKVLACSYLRLSHSNIETLEAAMTKAGKDPGIHIHSDVTDYDIWKNIKEERADLREAREAREAAESAMSVTKHAARARRSSIKH